MTSNSGSILKVALLLCAFLAMAAESRADIAAVSQLGYHPDSFKQAVLYTSLGSDSFQVIEKSTGEPVYSGAFAKPKNDNGDSVSCQGGMSCLVGDFSSFTREGSYYVKAGSGTISSDFRIGSDVFSSTSLLLLEPFSAWLQQGSGYHADVFKNVEPPFPMMADGSFIMKADMATLTLIRLGAAYNRNPGLFSTDKYYVTRDDTPDIAEHIRKYTDYVAMLQDYEPSSAVSEGWKNSFKCPWDVTPDTSKFNDAPQPCMSFVSETSDLNTAMALLAYVEAIPAIYQEEGKGAAQKLLDRAIKTEAYLRGRQMGSEASGFYAASLFLIYDYTGDEKYLRAAHGARGQVSKALDSLRTYGNEYYWEEYVRHKAGITGLGLEYEHGGKDPAEYFSDKLEQDWSRIRDPVSRNGERLFQYDNNIQFMNSRTMLAEAVIAAKAADFDSDEKFKVIADAQLAWLTGMNAVQHSSDSSGGGPLESRSFIFGIGKFPKEFHFQFTPASFFRNGWTFNNGLRYVPGWINGAFDTFGDGDGIYNYVDKHSYWQYTETTNEVVATAMELYSILDSQYNEKSTVGRPRLAGSSPDIPENPIQDPVTGAPSGPGIFVSKNPERSGSFELEGSVLKGDAYVFVQPDAKIRRVAFFIDDVSGSKPPYKIENSPAFDLAGTAPNGNALPFSAASLSVGQHTITAMVTFNDDTLQVASAAFTIAGSDDSGRPVQDPVNNPGNGGSDLPGNNQAATCTDRTVNQPCARLSEAYDGCTTTVWAEPGSTRPAIIAKACSKPDITLEVYRQSYDSSHDLEACFHAVCVDKNWGSRSGPDPDSPFQPSPGQGQPVTPKQFTASLSITSINGLFVGFLCDHDGGGSFNIDWFADREGKPQETLASDLKVKDFTHSFSESGTYAITCGVWSETMNSYADSVKEIKVDGSKDKMPKKPEISVPGLMLSFSPDRSGAVSLDGREVAGNIYVFAAPDRSVRKVEFYVDQSLNQVENWPAFDLSGTASDGSALPFSTSSLSPGSHVITAAVKLSDDSTRTLSATFTVKAGSDNKDEKEEKGEGGDEGGVRENPVQQQQVRLMFSSNGDRSGAQLLDGQEVTGKIYAFVVPDGGIAQARFYVDDETQSPSPVRIESLSPFDLGGTAGNRDSLPFSIEQWQPGTHSITTVVTFKDGTLQTLTATVVKTESKQNPSSPQRPVSPQLLVSESPDRSGAGPLGGSSVSGDIYVFAQPSGAITKVEFYIDDSGSVFQTENIPEFDLAGTHWDGSALPFDTGSLENGEHVVTAVVTFNDGAMQKVTSLFTVSNAAVGESQGDQFASPIQPDTPTLARVLIYSDDSQAQYQFSDGRVEVICSDASTQIIGPGEVAQPCTPGYVSILSAPSASSGQVDSVQQESVPSAPPTAQADSRSLIYLDEFQIQYSFGDGSIETICTNGVTAITGPGQDTPDCN